MTEQNSIEVDQLYINNHQEEPHGEIALWRAVVMQSLEDLTLSSSNKKYRRWRDQATKWFVDRDENFYAICECAGLSAEKVLNIASDIIARRE